MTPQQQIELVLLNWMVEQTPSEYRFCWYMPIKYISDALTIDFPITRGFLHSLKMRNMVEFGRGFDEDGMVAGSGYTVTHLGERHLKDLKTQLTLTREETREHVRHAHAGDWKGVNYG